MLPLRQLRGFKGAKAPLQIKGGNYLFRSKIALLRSRIPLAPMRAINLYRTHEDGMRFACRTEHFA